MADTPSAACVFPRCVDGEKPPHCGNCEGRETPYAHEYGASAALTQTGVNVVNTSTVDSAVPSLPKPHKKLGFFRNRWRLRRREQHDDRPYFEASIVFQAADMAEAERLWEAMEGALGCTGEGDDHVCPHFRVSGLHQLDEDGS